MVLLTFYKHDKPSSISQANVNALCLGYFSEVLFRSEVTPSYVIKLSSEPRRLKKETQFLAKCKFANEFDYLAKEAPLLLKEDLPPQPH